MKILIVDDIQSKIKDISKTILEIEGITKNNIDVAIDTTTARDKMTYNNYDILVLDLNMPESIIDEISQNAGQDFIDEIIEINSINKPTDIVILSAYEECEASFINEENRKAFHILRYNESSLEWKNRLKAIVNYRMIYTLQSGEEVIDYAIITTVPVETNAVRKLSPYWQKLSFKNDPFEYYITEFNSDTSKKKVVSIQSSDMGMVAATISTMNLYKHFKPKYIFISGIAAGIGDHNLGDILIPSEVWNYTCGKYIEKDGNLIFLPDPKSIPLDAKISDIVKRDHSSILQKIHDSWEIKNEVDLTIKETKLSLYSAPLACGTSVVANFDVVKDFILQHSRKTQGIDMESYGVFSAARSICDDQPLSICVKSISDFADKDKGDGFQPYASYTSAMFIKYLITDVL